MHYTYIYIYMYVYMNIYIYIYIPIYICIAGGAVRLRAGGGTPTRGPEDARGGGGAA